MHPIRRSQGFTLIELLVVMAIIATLASLGIVGIPAILRQADITASKAHLGTVYKMFQIYQTKYKGLSPRSGPSFVLSIWDSGIVDHTQKDAEIFFCASTGNLAEADLSNVTPEGIDWTGPDQSQRRRKRLRLQDRNANEKVIVANKVPIVETDEDLDLLPHAGKGICYLTLGGMVDFQDTADFGGDYPIIGPDSPLEQFTRLVPDEGDYGYDDR